MAEPEITILGGICGTFTVDTSGPLEVAITPADAFLVGAVGAGLDTYFDQEDNFRLLSLWVVYPYCFCQGNTDVLRMQIRGRSKAVAHPLITFNMRAMPSNGWQFIPVENVETGLGTFVNYDNNPDTPPDPWGLYARVTGYVSMVNAPDVLDQQELDVWAYAKVAHNIPMIS